MKKIAIIGAGIAGLSLGWFLKKRNQDFVIFEQKERAGGLIQTIEKDGFLFEYGPRGFRSSGKGQSTLQLAKDLELEKELIAASQLSKKRYLYQGGRLRLLSPFYLLKAGGLSALLKDLSVSKTNKEDETIADFTKRRFGEKILKKMIDPLVLGIYAGDAEKLSMKSCFPNLWKLEQENRSILKGFLKSKKKEKATLFSFRKGMQTLTDTLSQKLKEQLFLNSPVTQIETLKKGFLLTTLEREIYFDCVVSAIPDFALARLFQKFQPAPSVSLSVVSLGWHNKELPQAGYGFLAPTSEKKLFLGMTNEGEIFKTKKEIRLSIMIQTEAAAEKLKDIGLALVHDLFGLKNPDAILIHRVEKAITQYHLGHHHKLERFRKMLPENFHLLGRSFDGVGVNDCTAAAKNLSTLF